MIAIVRMESERTAANTAVHRRYTFARRGKPSRRDLVLGGTAVFATSLTVTFLALGLVDWAGVTSWWLVAGLLVLANAAAALVRFVVLRSWIFRTAQTNPPLDVTRAMAPRPVLLHERQTG